MGEKGIEVDVRCVGGMGLVEEMRLVEIRRGEMRSSLSETLKEFRGV